LDQAAQGGGGVPIPGEVQKTCGCGTSGHGLVGKVVLRGWLDSMILEGLSNLWFYDFMILRELAARGARVALQWKRPRHREQSTRALGWRRNNNCNNSNRA